MEDIFNYLDYDHKITVLTGNGGLNFQISICFIEKEVNKSDRVRK